MAMTFKKRIDERMKVLSILKKDKKLQKFIDAIIYYLKQNEPIYIAGCGGSAAEASHFTAELVGRYRKDRKPYNATCLGSDLSTITAITNDYGSDEIFSREFEAKTTYDGIFFGLSTSGNSESIIEACAVAKRLDRPTFFLTGRDGGHVVTAKLADHVYIVPSKDTAIIQEMHLTIIHEICERLEP